MANETKAEPEHAVEDVAGLDELADAVLRGSISELLPRVVGVGA